MNLSDKLQTLIMMGIKMAGTYDPERALSMVEEQMTFDEHAVVQKFLNWIVANDKSFGPMNIRAVWAEFTNAQEANRAGVTDRKFKQVELHINSDPSFTRKFGSRVKGVGGRFSRASKSNCRYVYLPAATKSDADLINEIVKAFPFPKKTVMVAREFVDGRLERLPSWVQVQHYEGVGEPMEFLLKSVSLGIDSALRRGMVRSEPEELHGLLGTPVKASNIQPSLLVALEFGYRCAEKGMNLQQTVDEFSANLAA